MKEEKFLKIADVVNFAKIEEGMSIGDFGCGSHGELALLVSRIVGSKGNIFAVDLIKNHLDAIKRKARVQNLKNIHTIWADLELHNSTGINNNSLDVVFLNSVLHQCQNPSEVLREVYRTIKQRGRVVVVEWSSHALPLGPKHDYRIRKDDIENIAKKIGFKLEDKQEFGAYHYGLIFSK